MQLSPVVHTKLPCWCPNCGCADRMKFPVPIGQSLVGCMECMETWPREKLVQMTQITVPAEERLTLRD